METYCSVIARPLLSLFLATALYWARPACAIFVSIQKWLGNIKASASESFSNLGCYGITSLAIPLYHDDHSTVNGQLMKDLLMTFLNQCTIPVEIYEKYVPQSSKMVPLLERLCGPLSEEKVYELKKKICFECD